MNGCPFCDIAKPVLVRNQYALAINDKNPILNPKPASPPQRSGFKATAAWKIDETKEKFAKQSTENLRCPLSGIVTLDGGP
jgi:hypothetical protein